MDSTAPAARVVVSFMVMLLDGFGLPDFIEGHRNVDAGLVSISKIL
jgi:hypothetical protein